MQAPKAIIIGSGIAGMSTAIRLAVQGFDVSVFEANAYPGGKLSMFEKDGFRFDAGPSLFTQPQNIEDLFALANEPIHEYFQYQPVDVACRYFFENGKRVIAYTDTDKYAAELQVQLQEEPASLRRYLSAAANLYNRIGIIFLDYSLHTFSTWFHKRIFAAFRALRLSYLFQSLHAYNTRQFKSDEAVQIFNRYATYNGSNPYQAPGMLSVIPHLEQNQGTFYPRGGMISITNALYQLALKKGVQFFFNTKVTGIRENAGRVEGVMVQDEFVAAPIVVSNADVYFTYHHLLDNQKRANQLLKLERSSSALIFYWGIRQSFEPFGLHNILFGQQYESEFKHLFETRTLIDDPTIYINITSKEEAAHAPEGHENWFVMINAPANSGQDWEALTAAARKSIIEKINRMLGVDLESMIVSETILDPVMIEQRTGSFMGSLYGTSSNNVFAAFLRPANFTSRIKGLYFCGGTVHPGGGIPLCMKSATITANLIQSDHTHLFK